MSKVVTSKKIGSVATAIMKQKQSKNDTIIKLLTTTDGKFFICCDEAETLKNGGSIKSTELLACLFLIKFRHITTIYPTG